MKQLEHHQYQNSVQKTPEHITKMKKAIKPLYNLYSSKIEKKRDHILEKIVALIKKETNYSDLESIRTCMIHPCFIENKTGRKSVEEAIKEYEKFIESKEYKKHFEKIESLFDSCKNK